MPTQKEEPSAEIEVHVHSPFEQPQNADIVLRSSNGEDFHTRRILLSLGSDVFDTMFTLPQAPREPQEGTSQDGPPVIPLAEESDIVYQLLRWLDPRCRPSWELKDMQLVLNAADKYSMQGVMQHIEQVLMRCPQYTNADPVLIYAIAIRYGFHELARQAAKESLRLTLEERTSLPELAFIPAQALQHLYNYYFTCANAAYEVATDFEFGWLGDIQSNFVWGPDHPKDHSTSCPNIRQENQLWQKWWADYMELAAQELYKRPRGLTVQAIPRFATVALRVAAKCATCRSKAYSNMLTFGSAFAAEVEKQISAVRLSSSYVRFQRK